MSLEARSAAATDAQGAADRIVGREKDVGQMEVPGSAKVGGIFANSLPEPSAIGVAQAAGVTGLLETVDQDENEIDDDDDEHVEIDPLEDMDSDQEEDSDDDKDEDDDDDDDGDDDDDDDVEEDEDDGGDDAAETSSDGKNNLKLLVADDEVSDDEDDFEPGEDDGDEDDELDEDEGADESFNVLEDQQQSAEKSSRKRGVDLGGGDEAESSVKKARGEQQNGSTTVEKQPKPAVFPTKVQSLLSSLNGKSKQPTSVLESSRQNWEAAKEQDPNMKNELETHLKSKDSFVDKQEFLMRTTDKTESVANASPGRRQK